MGSARWFRLCIGLLLVIGATSILLSDVDPTWNGHPAYPTLLLVTVALGLTLIAFAFFPWQLDPEPAGPPWEVADRPDNGDAVVARTTAPAGRPGIRRRRRRLVLRTLGSALALLLIIALAWLRPFGAGPDSVAAMQSTASVTVIDNPTSIEFVPVQPVSVGLVFSPGARVDARAYAALLHPVAEAGYLVIVLKEPFGLAVTSSDQASGPIADHPEISVWATGGHSLGGVVASDFAADNRATVSGLLLWASYPNQDLSTDDALQVESIYGSNDLLTTPAAIENSKTKLPLNTTYVQIDGGVHAYFADYGEQPGDGQPTGSRELASAQITAATISFLGKLSALSSPG